MMSATLWTVIEPVPSLTAEPSRLAVMDSGSFDFGDEQVVLRGDVDSNGQWLDTDARAVILSGGKVAVVGATRLTLPDSRRWTWTTPWTGVLERE